MNSIVALLTCYDSRLMNGDWVRIWNRIFGIIDGEVYFSGGRFISAVREIDPYFPDYNQFIEERRRAGRSTSRRDFFYDILRDLDAPRRAAVLNRIVDAIAGVQPDVAAEIRGVIAGGLGPVAEVPAAAWNADRLNGYLREIDGAIAAEQHERAVTLGYTCLEGFYKAFVVSKGGPPQMNEIGELSRWIRDHLKGNLPGYPDEVHNLINSVTHAIDRARNRFSEAHFAGEAGRWLAVYVRDLVNTQIRLLLTFM